MSALPVPMYGSQFEAESLSKLGSSAKLRVGLVVPSTDAPRWVAHLVQQIATSTYADLVLVAIDSSHDERGNAQGSLSFRLWNKFDAVLNGRPDDAFSLCDLKTLIKNVPTVQLSAEQGEIPEPLRSAQLDVLLAIDGSAARERMKDWAKYGVWFLSGNRSHRDSPSNSLKAAWQGSEVAATTLEVVDAQGRVETICRSYSATNEISPYLGDTTDAWKSADMVLRALRDVHCFGWEHVRNCSSKKLPFASSQSRNSSGIRFLVRWFDKTARYKLNRTLRKEHWFVAYRKNDGKIPLSAAEMRGFRVIVPPADRFYADPFLFERNGRHYLFFEDYRYELKRGLIACLELNDDGRPGEPEVILDLPYHLSYPTIIEYQGECFLIVESAANRTVEMYRALDFPRRWTLEKVLLKDVPAIDPTIFEYEDRTWLFVGGMVDRGSTNDELFLYSAENLFGDWVPHPRNPVVSDVRRARPAGRVFAHGGKLIRPSQDCSIRYGRAVVLNRIDTLSATEYLETPIGRIAPEWYPHNLGTHTFNQTERFQVVDGRVLAFR